MIAALGRRHRADDRLHARHLLLVGRVLGELLQVAEPRDHTQNALERAHPLDRPELAAEVVERELVLAELGFERFGLVFVDRLLRLLDERQHVAHAEHARDDAIRVKELEVLEALAAADERNRHPDDRHHGEGCAAPRVAVELRQHDAGDADPPIEFTGALDGVLPGHRVGDVQQVRRLHGVLDRVQFLHQLLVDVEPACGVDDHRIEALGLGLGERAPGSCDRLHRFRREHAHVGLLAEHGELFDRGGTPHVGRHHERMASLTREPSAQFGGGRRLARALEAEQPAAARGWRMLLQAAFGVAEEREQLVADDPDDLLPRSETAEHGLIHRAVADAVDECLDDFEIDVGLEQREPDLVERRFHLLGREAHLAPQRCEDFLDAGAE